MVINFVTDVFNNLWKSITESITSLFNFIYDAITSNICMIVYTIISGFESMLNKLRSYIPYALGFIMMYELLTRAFKKGGIKSILLSIIGSVSTAYIIDYLTPVNIELPKPVCKALIGEVYEERNISIRMEEFFSEVRYE